MASFPELSKRGVAVDQRHEVTSTNELLKAWLAQGDHQQPLMMIADQQTAGHGKFSRHFYSAANSGAYFSIGLPLATLPQGWSPERMTVTAAVAAYQVATSVFGCALTIKWVNDLYRGDGKVTGILAEAALDTSNQLQGLVVGWGINLTQQQGLPAALKARVSYLSAQPVGHEQRKAFVDKVVARFLDLQEAPWQAVLAIYRQHQYLQGKELVVTAGDKTFQGSFDEITDEGYLRIKTPAGPQTFTAGTVRVQQ